MHTKEVMWRRLIYQALSFLKNWKWRIRSHNKTKRLVSRIFGDGCTRIIQPIYGYFKKYQAQTRFMEHWNQYWYFIKKILKLYCNLDSKKMPMIFVWPKKLSRENKWQQCLVWNIWRYLIVIINKLLFSLNGWNKNTKWKYWKN